MKGILVLLFFSVVMFSSCTATVADRESSTTISDPSPSTSHQSESEQRVPFTARFEIYTNGTKRVFTQAMYHNLSPDVYIEAVSPDVIQVKRNNLTWNDFFKTLPFSLTKECLVTGTKQTFCTSETSKLRFFLNGEEVPDALDNTMKSDDTLKVVYGE